LARVPSRSKTAARSVSTPVPRAPLTGRSRTSVATRMAGDLSGSGGGAGSGDVAGSACGAALGRRLVTAEAVSPWRTAVLGRHATDGAAATEGNVPFTAFGDLKTA